MVRAVPLPGNTDGAKPAAHAEKPANGSTQEEADDVDLRKDGEELRVPGNYGWRDAYCKQTSDGTDHGGDQGGEVGLAKWRFASHVGRREMNLRRPVP